MSADPTPTPPSASGGANPATSNKSCCPLDVKVTIKNGTGTKGPCRLVAKGKTFKFKAIVTHDGGTYKWKADGKVSVKGSNTSQVVEVKGDNTSGVLDDSKLTVTYTRCGKTAKDTIKLTVYNISKIEAKLKGTPCKRDGSRADTMPAKFSTKDNKTFDATAITITKGCGDLKLNATVAPAGVTVSWTVERASDDASGLSGTPVHAVDGANTKHKITADAAGSFHVSAFIDCNGNGKRDPDEGAIILNLNIVDIEVIAGAANNKIIKRTTHFNSTSSSASYLVVHSGSTGGVAPGVNASYTDAEFTKHPLAIKLVVKLIGGGSDKRRGTDKVRLGFIQTTTADSVKGTYSDGRTLKEVIAQNAALADPIKSGSPTMLAFPVRDTRGSANSGSGPYIISSSDMEKSNIVGGGLKRVVRFVDPPGIVLPKKHPVTTSNLKTISGTNDFQAFVSAYSKDFDENYVVIASATWSIGYGTYTTITGWSNTGAAITAASTMTTYSPPKKGKDTNVERCPPNFVDNLKMDAR